MIPHPLPLIALLLAATVCPLPSAIGGGGTTGEARSTYPWENNTLGEEETVPPPWTPVERSGNSLAVWGRSFVFEDSALPSTILTQNRTVFVRPPTLVVRTSGGNLSEAPAAGAVIAGESPAGAVVTSSWTLPDAEVRARCGLEFDGFCKVEIEVVPTGEQVRLEEFALEFVFPKEFAERFSRFVEYDFETQRLDRADFIKSFGLLDAPREFPFNPAVWVGNSRVGIEWSCETDRGWSPRGDARAIRIEPRDGEVSMAITVVGRPEALEEPFRFVFALYPTPVKPRREGARAVRIVNGWSFGGPNGEVPEELDVFGFAWSEKFPVKHTGLPGFSPAANEAGAARIARGLERMRSRGIKVIQYGSLYGFPPELPRGEWKDYADEWLADDLEKMPSNAGWARRSGLPPGTPSILYVSMAPESIRDMLVWSYAQARETDGTDGLYFDLSSPNMLSRNPRHPNGDWVAQGGIHYPFFAQRELMKRLYRTLKAADPDYLITQHHAKVPVVVSGFTDVVLMGEGLNMVFRGPGWSIQSQAVDPAAYVPDYGTLPPEIFGTEFNQNRGAVYMLLPQIFKRNQQALDSVPGLFARLSQGLLARCAVYDVPVMSVRLEPESLRRYEEVLGRAGWLIGDEYLDPDEATRLFRKESPLVRSVYLNKEKGRMAVAIGNFTGKSETTNLDMNLDAVREEGIGLDWIVTEAVDNKELGTAESAMNTPMEIPPDSFRLLLFSAPPES